MAPSLGKASLDWRRSGTKSWSWTIGRLAGVPVRVHASFWLLLAWIALSHVLQGQGAFEAVVGMLLVLSLLGCVVLHELGHVLVARHFGVRTRAVTLLPIGGVADLERMPDRPSQELAVALAGPLVSLAMGAGLFVTLAVVEGPTGLEGPTLIGAPFFSQLMWINLVLAAFNLLPTFPLDGGRALRAGLAMRMDRGAATAFAARIGQTVAVSFGIAGVLFNPVLVIVAVFVWMGAKGEASLLELKSALSRMRVSEAMIAQFLVLRPEDSLARAVELTREGFQQDFPVMRGKEIAGVLTHQNLIEGLSSRGESAAVELVMTEKVDLVHPDELLQSAFERMRSRDGRRVLVVVRGTEVIGLITPRNIGELLTMDEALQRSHAVRYRGAA